MTKFVGILGLAITGILATAQFSAVLRPYDAWTIENVYGGNPDATDPKAYFAINQGWAYADSFFWAPIQLMGCVGMLFGRRWGFLLALIGSTPFWYTSVIIYIWDRDLGFRENSFYYWVVIFGMFPVYGIVEGVYCFVRLLHTDHHD